MPPAPRTGSWPTAQRSPSKACPLPCRHPVPSTLPVKAGVECVEHGDDLQRGALGTDGRGTYDVREEHADIAKALWPCTGMALTQLPRHPRWGKWNRVGPPSSVSPPRAWWACSSVAFSLPSLFLQAVLGPGLLPDQHHPAVRCGWGCQRYSPSAREVFQSVHEGEPRNRMELTPPCRSSGLGGPSPV